MPGLDDYELEKKLRALSAGSKIVIVLMIAAFAVMARGFIYNSRITVLCALATAVLCIILWALNRKKIKQLVGGNVTRGVLEKTFELSEYHPHKAIEETLLREAEMRFTWHKSQGSDYFRAKYRGTDFMFSDIRLTKEKSSTGGDGTESREDVMVFRGQWLIVNIGRKLKTPLIATELSGNVLPGSQIKTRPVVETGSEAFNKIFRVLTDDETMVSPILTPRFMEYLMSPKQTAKGKKHLCFTGSRAHIAISTGRDTFGPGRNIMDIPALRESIQNEAALIKKTLDEFLLNEALFEPVQKDLTVS